jgi:hypothetical protein
VKGKLYLKIEAERKRSTMNLDNRILELIAVAHPSPPTANPVWITTSAKPSNLEPIASRSPKPSKWASGCGRARLLSWTNSSSAWIAPILLPLTPPPIGVAVVRKSPYAETASQCRFARRALGCPPTIGIRRVIEEQPESGT